VSTIGNVIELKARRHISYYTSWSA